MNKYKLRSNLGEQIYTMLVYSIIIIAVWFITPLSDFYKDKLLKYFFNQKLKDGKYFILIILLFITSTIPLFINKGRVFKNRYLVDLKYLSPVVSFLALYLYYRFFSNEYLFYSLFEADYRSMIKILDLPTLILSIYFIGLFFNSIFEIKNKPSYESLLIVDSPLENIEEDEFERRKYYDSIIYVISTAIGKEGKALSIGLVNRWGEGKTSFIKFLKDEIEKDSNTIFIEFNAWYSSNSNNLTLDFFQTIDHELSRYTHTGSILRKYAKSLTNINDSLNPFNYLPDHWIGERSNKEYFDDINKLISKLNKRIIVAIDDLDRLDNREVYAVFQVIRNSANFDKLVFITPFDKEYVLHALNELRIHNPEDYIKKMFDVELSIPVISNLNLIKSFNTAFIHSISRLTKLADTNKKELDNQMKNILQPDIYSALSTSKYTLINSMLYKHLKNKRDLIRFVNSLVANFNDSHDILYLPDVLILELIRYLNVNVYFELFETQNYFTSKMSSNNIRINQLFNDGDNIDLFRQEELLDIGEKLIDEGLKEDLIILIKSLFTSPSTSDFNSEFSFYYNKNYSNYHQYNYTSVRKKDIDILLGTE